MAGHVEWYGDKLSARMREAARAAIDDTMADCVEVASSMLPGSSDGPTRSSVKIIEPARPGTDGHVRGLWGSKWFLVWILEVGSFRHRSGWDIRPQPSHGKKALANSGTLFGRRVHHPAITGRHALRNASDIVYPILTWRIAKAFARGRRS